MCEVKTVKRNVKGRTTVELCGRKRERAAERAAKRARRNKPEMTFYSVILQATELSEMDKKILKKKVIYPWPKMIFNTHSTLIGKCALEQEGYLQ